MAKETYSIPANGSPPLNSTEGLNSGSAAGGIDWICSQQVGQEIAQIGWNDGLVSAVLAREGQRVAILCVSELEYAAAQTHIASLPVEQQRRVTPFAINRMAAEPQREGFETVAFLYSPVGDLDLPENFESVYAFLRSGGSIVSAIIVEDDASIIAPLIEAIYPYFEVSEFERLEGLIGLKAEKRDSPVRGIDKGAISRLLAPLEHERLSHSEQLSRLKRELDELKAEKATLQRLVEKARTDARARPKGNSAEDPLVKSSEILRRNNNLEAANQRLASEVEKLRNSRSFRLGNAIVGFAKNPSPRSIPGLIRSLRHALRPMQTRQLPELPQIPRREAEPTATRDAGRRPQERGRFRVMGIMDAFTLASYQPECDFEQLRPDSWAEQLARYRPDFVFIESAWNGDENLWNGKLSNNSYEIQQMLSWCRKSRVPTVFWNKEDPVHFSTFLPVAAQVDFVFTTDVDCISAYKYALGHDRVHLLPFAAQPASHNPIEVYERQVAACFAGSYYLRYPERQRDFSTVVDAVRSSMPVEIFDRNHGRDHPHYRFPAKYNELVQGGVPFSQIDKAYKGYRFGINLNTIKHSQSMFARRVFELMASNTIVVSNFSRGARLMFGDLIISTDSSLEISRAVESLISDETYFRKLRLLALRRVLQHHTYAERLRSIASVLFDEIPEKSQPSIVILAAANSVEEYERIVSSFERQNYQGELNLLVVSPDAQAAGGGFVFRDVEECLAAYEAGFRDADYVGAFSADDYYGPNYVTDLALGATYADKAGFGKVGQFLMLSDQPTIEAPDAVYRPAAVLNPRSSIFARGIVDNSLARSWLSASSIPDVSHPNLLALDEFNYCREGASFGNPGIFNDLEVAYEGCDLSRLTELSEVAPALPPRYIEDGKIRVLDSIFLSQMFKSEGPVSIELDSDETLAIHSRMGASDRHRYIWDSRTHARDELRLRDTSTITLDWAHCEGSVQFACEYYDAWSSKLSHTILRTKGAHTLPIPAECETIRFGLRLEGPVEANLKRVLLGSGHSAPSVVLGKSRILVLTKQYPRYDDLYRYGFLHSRVRAYREAGVVVDVMRFRPNASGLFEEFEGIDVAEVDEHTLQQSLSLGGYSHVLIHVLDATMWQAIKPYLGKLKVIVWLHGAEIQLWNRREFEFERMSPEEIARQKRLSDRRKRLWQEVFQHVGDDLKLVAVSQYFKAEIEDDYGVTLPSQHVEIIHNHIDESVFTYSPKNPDQRFRILSIRPYASRKYANDLSTEAILHLSTRPIFRELTFCLVGDGDLFDEITAPISHFSNVTLMKTFLSQREIAEYHKEFGIFLSPTRMDAQGVSRDEAMSSGLVPITTRVAAIPEFVDDDCGMVVQPEDSLAIANAIEELCRNPEKFSALSERAASRVRKQSGRDETIVRELGLFIDHTS